jgi:hypothetical protein
VLSFCLLASVAAAEGQYSGTVESFGDGVLVVKTTKGGTGHWKVVPTTQISGSKSFRAGDWVSLEVEKSGHLISLTFEERPSARAGVIKKIQGKVLSVRSGNDVEDWNIMQTTLLSGLSVKDLTVGDAIGAKLYKNHNLAELHVTKSGAK